MTLWVKTLHWRVLGNRKFFKFLRETFFQVLFGSEGSGFGFWCVFFSKIQRDNISFLFMQISSLSDNF